MDLALRNSRAIITGGSSGLGLAIADRLAAEGASVGLVARTAARLEAAASFLRERHEVTVATATADVTDSAALNRAVDEIAGTLGGLGLVVANAGGAVGGDLLDGSPEDYLATFALNAGHAAALVKAAHPHLVAAGRGAVAIISSVTGVRPGPRSSYATAKAAEIHLAATLALELASDNIRVNAISPGSFVTDETTGWGRLRAEQPEAFHHYVADNFPLGRLAEVGEIADVVTFVLSERASWITGTNIVVDGAQHQPTVRRFPHLSG